MRITVEGRPGDDARRGSTSGARPGASTTPGAHPVDVDVPEGVRLGDLRAPLAALTGIDEIASPGSPLAVGALAVGDDQLCGLAPLETGCTLAVGPPRPDPFSAALRAVWHLAVVAGPDAGGLLGIDGTAVVGRGPAADLQIDDPLISRRHLTVRRHGERLQVRDDGSRNGTERRRRGRSRALTRRVGRRHPSGRWHRLRDADRLSIGSTWIEVRHRDRMSARAAAAEPPGTSEASSDPTTPIASPIASPMALSAWFTPVVSAVVFALGTGNPRMLLLAATGPALGVVHLAIRLRTRRHVRRRPHHPGGAMPRQGQSASRALEASEHRAVVVPSPADVLTDTIRLHERHPGTVAVHALHLSKLAPEACLAVVGPREQALAVARGLVLAATAPGAPDGAPSLVISHPPDAVPQWSWCRWIGVAEPSAAHSTLDGFARRSQAPDGTVTESRPHVAALTVIDPAGGPWPTWASSRWRDAPAGSQLIVVAGRRGDVPPWCRTFLEVEEGHAVARLQRSDGRIHPVPLPGVSVRTAEDQSRRTAALRARTATANGPEGLPGCVSWSRLPGAPRVRDGSGADEIARRWSVSSTDPGLAVPIGIGAGGTVVRLDLAADGPHALVAGTTGAGKSALLQTLVLGLATTRSPADLAIALIDYKGGASLGDCARLPHVVGQVTDLDPALAMRALAGLRHELRLREHLIAERGVSDLTQLRATWTTHASGPATSPGEAMTPPPRLLVVVDEFRALADDLPDFIPDLLRIAAQGRSLGMHLVLATQRPGGAVSADMRANISLRIALRVTHETDSHDIVGVPDAASIPARFPGRAVVRRGTSPPESVQVAHADVPVDLAGGSPGVRLATGWADPIPVAGDARPPAAHAATNAPAATGLSATVDAVVAAAEATGVRVSRAPWLPELPTFLPLSDLADVDRSPDLPLARDLPFALADVPESQGRAVVGLTGGRHLLVVGGAGSGRSTTVRTLAVSGLSAGWHVHAVGLEGHLEDLTGHPCLGTVVGHGDARLLGRLLDLLVARDGSGVPTLLVVDGLESMLDALDKLGHDRGRATLACLLRDARSRDVTVVATSAPSTRVHGEFPEVVVLSGADPVTRTMLGVPTTLGTTDAPGRAVRLGADVPRACQVAVAVAAAGHPRRTVPPGNDPLRLRAVPLDAPVAQILTRDDVSTWVGIGLGGDDASETGLDVSRGALVVGPPGSGRSTALGVLARRLRRGPVVHVVTADGAPLPGGLALAPATATWSFDLAALHGLTDAITRAEAPLVVVVDDLDDLERRRPLACAELTDLLGTPSPHGHLRAIVASARTARVCTAYREPWTSLRATRRGIVLSPGDPGSSDVFGTPLDAYRDHGHPHLPGRGVVQVGAEVTPVQVYRDVDPPTGPRGA